MFLCGYNEHTHTQRFLAHIFCNLHSLKKVPHPLSCHINAFPCFEMLILFFLILRNATKLKLGTLYTQAFQTCHQKQCLLAPFIPKHSKPAIKSSASWHPLYPKHSKSAIKSSASWHPLYPNIPNLPSKAVPLGTLLYPSIPNLPSKAVPLGTLYTQASQTCHQKQCLLAPFIPKHPKPAIKSSASYSILKLGTQILSGKKDFFCNFFQAYPIRI